MRKLDFFVGLNPVSIFFPGIDIPDPPSGPGIHSVETGVQVWRPYLLLNLLLNLLLRHAMYTETRRNTQPAPQNKRITLFKFDMNLRMR